MKWLKTAEVAEMIRETRANVSRRAKRGEFPGAIQMGRSWRIPQTGLDAFLTPLAEPETDPVTPPAFMTADRKRALDRAS